MSHNLAASLIAYERSVLGLALSGSSDILDLAPGFGISEHTFSLPVHARIWSAIAIQVKAGISPDLVIIADALRRANPTSDDERLSPAYLIELVESAPVAQNSAFHLSELSAISWAIRASLRLRELSRELESASPGDWDMLRSRLEGAMVALSHDAIQAQRKSPIELADRMAEEIDRRIAIARAGGLRGIPTGFRILDRIMGGWVEGRLHVVAARPGTGKTVLGAEFVEAANSAGIPWTYCTLEMDALALKERRLVRRAAVSNFKVQSGMLNDNEISALANANIHQGNRDIGEIDDRCMRYLETLKATIRRDNRQSGTKLFVIDYLQQVRIRDRRFSSRKEEIELITFELKQMALEEGVAIVAMAQLSRGAETASQTLLSHLKDSGSIEQDADAVMFLERQSDSYGATDPLWLVIAKNRHGPCCRFPLDADLSVNKIQQANINEEAFTQ